MQGLMILTSIVIWVSSIAIPQLGSLIYLLWSVAFILMFYAWSLFFSITALLATVSFFYLDTSSSSVFISAFLPWFCGISTFTTLIPLIVKYPTFLGGDSDGGGGGGGGGDCGS